MPNGHRSLYHWLDGINMQIQYISTKTSLEVDRVDIWKYRFFPTLWPRASRTTQTNGNNKPFSACHGACLELRIYGVDFSFCAVLSWTARISTMISENSKKKNTLLLSPSWYKFAFFFHTSGESSSFFMRKKAHDMTSKKNIIYASHNQNVSPEPWWAKVPKRSVQIDPRSLPKLLPSPETSSFALKKALLQQLGDQSISTYIYIDRYR